MDTSRAIGFLAGWQHCIHTGSYWAWLIGYVVIALGGIIFFKEYQRKLDKVGGPKDKDLDSYFTILCIAAIIGFFCFLLIRPCDVGVSTSINMAARGHYLGY